MNSKERVHNALQRKPVDRVPIWMWFHPVTTNRLAQRLELPANQVAIAFGDDVRQTWVNHNYAMEGIVHENEGDTHTDFWGVTWRKEGAFNQALNAPLEHVDRDTCLNYSFPYAHLETLLAQMHPVIAHAETFFIGCDVSPCVYEMYGRLRGMETATLDLALDTALAATMLERCADFAVALAQEACTRFPLDWLWLGDDVAGQHATIMSPDMWRELVKPHLKRVADVGRAANLPVAYHSCGAIRAIIPDLIEIGIGILNPLQCNCPGMDPPELKREFGDRLAFMGGVDTQELLPNATANEVRCATEHLVESMTSDGGGYILAASHTVPPETPDENIFAMYEGAGISREEIFDRAATLRATHNQ